MVFAGESSDATELDAGDLELASVEDFSPFVDFSIDFEPVEPPPEGERWSVE